jgi:hypothetical protein
LYCLPYYAEAVSELVKVTKNKIYITSPFYDGDIDFISKIYPNVSEGDGSVYTYSNSYSVPKFEKYCKSLGVKKVEFEDMRLDFDLEPPAHPSILQTYTIKTESAGRLEATGVLLLNWKLVTLTL